jgi:hypothetical protein
MCQVSFHCGLCAMEPPPLSELLTVSRKYCNLNHVYNFTGGYFTHSKLSYVFVGYVSDVTPNRLIFASIQMSASNLGRDTCCRY